MRISGRKLDNKNGLCKVAISNYYFNFNIGYSISVDISSELSSEVLMSKTKLNKTKIDDIEIN